MRMSRYRRAGVCVLMASFAACGPPAVIGPEPNEPQTEPQSQGAEEHRQDAKLEVARLRAHQEKYDPKARETQRRCDADRSELNPEEPICWYETINPTAIHLQEVEAHRLHAAYHRKAARELTAAEEQACKGVAKADRNESPFAHQGDILGVSPLEVATGRGNRHKQLVGATVLFQPVPGLTQRALQRLMDCHIAQNAVIGFEKAATEMTLCPLTLRGVRADVRKVGEGFAVEIRSSDSSAAQIVWQRAQALSTVD